jgi:hypothetical protein
MEELTNDVNMTTAILYFNGSAVGVFTSHKNVHAEDFIIRFLDEYLSDDIIDEDIQNLRTIYEPRSIAKIDVFITRSPCDQCGPKVIQLARHLEGMRLSSLGKFIRLRFFCATIWKGNNLGGVGAQEIQKIRNANIQSFRIFRWDYESMKDHDPSSSNLALVIGKSANAIEMAAHGKSNRPAHKLGSRTTGIPETILPDKKKFGAKWRKWFQPDETDRLSKSDDAMSGDDSSGDENM